MGQTKKKNDLPDSTMGLGDHLEELRYRLIMAIVGLVVASIICLVFGRLIIAFIQRPYNQLNPEHPLRALAPADAFTSYMKVSLISGLIISSPWVFYQIWMFVAAGLYSHERRYVRLTVPFSAALFVAGALFFLFVVAPLSLAFFLNFGKLINVSSDWTFQNYISFMTLLMLIFGLGFQMPIAILILARTGIVSVAALRRSRKYVVLLIFVIAAIATPGPDVVSQVSLALPLYALFELGIVLSHVSGGRKKS